MIKKTFAVMFTLIAILAFSPSALAEYKYIIQNSTTEHIIDKPNTNAVIDVEENHIRLPRGNPGGISFLGEDSFDVIVLTANGIEKISPTGESKTLVEINQLSNPTAVFAGGFYPDIIVVEDDTTNTGKAQITHFSHIGNDIYNENSNLTILGLDKTIKIVSRSLDRATLTEQGDFLYHHWLGEIYHSRNIEKFSNPLDMALLNDNYDALVVDEKGVKYIKDLTSTSTLLTGRFSAIAADAGSSFTVLDDTNATHYHIVDGEVHKNDWLTIKTGLDAPSAIALRPGSYDRAIVDGDLIKFYFWTGEKLTLVGEVPFNVLDGIGKYIPQARLSSRVLNVLDKGGNSLDITHVRFNHGLIDTFDGVTNKYQIEWYVSTHADLLKSIEEIDKKDFSDLSKWKKINTSTDWYQLDTPASDIRYMVILKTFDRDYTPRIHEFIEIELRVELQPPKLNVPSIYYTSNPEIWWEFDDSGIDKAKQSAFQVVVFNNADEEILNTGKVLSRQSSYVIRSTDKHESLWGEQTDKFKVQVKVWDDAGNESLFSEKKGFKVLAFDRPVITKIVSPPMMGREWINRFTESMTLPVAKAGTAVTFRIYGIGVDILDKVDIYYPGSRSLDKNNDWNIVNSSVLQPIDIRPSVAYLQEFTVVAGYDDKTNKVWEATFFTEADTDKCPNGTVIAGRFYTKDFNEGNSPLLIMDDYKNYKERKTPADGDSWTTWEGYRWWAEGITITNDTVLSDWIVVLKAKD